jgi:DHA1 family inner membrane transport protein
MSAAMHAPFFGVCMSVAATVAPPAKKTQAIALVQAGANIPTKLLIIKIATKIGNRRWA